MDDLDRRLLALLREDARQPVASLAAALGVTRATVRVRLDRLIADGVVKGFTVVTDLDPEAPSVRALMLIEIEGRRAEEVARQLQGFPEVRALYTTNGRWDMVAELGTDDVAAFDRLLSRIRRIDGIAVTESSLLLAPRKGTPGRLF